MRTDYELLELAARAAGHYALLSTPMSRTEVSYLVEEVDGGPLTPWNPLDDDGDALRLAVKLMIEVERASDGDVYAGPAKTAKWLEQLCDHADAYAAVRRAIVHAAAEIGAAMANQPIEVS